MTQVSAMQSCNTDQEAAMMPARIYHSTCATHRASILEHGLSTQFDKTGMGAIFFTDTQPPARRGFDQWVVSTLGLEVHEDTTTEAPEGRWFMVFSDLPADTLEIVSL